jgi:lipopolysaccharide export system permease protein
MLSLIVDKGVEVQTVLMMIFNLSLSFFPLAAPLASFFATIFVLNKLSEDSEIIAMRSFGITRWQIYVPFLIASLSTAICINALSSVLIPKANADFKNTVVKLTSSGMLTSIKSGQFFTDIPNVTLFAKEVSEDGNGFDNVFLHLSNKQTKEQKIIFAKTGTLIKIFADDWHAPALRLHLKEGNIVNFDKKGNKIEKILFQEYDFPILNANLTNESLDKDSMKTNTELKLLIAKKEIELKKSKADKMSDNQILNFKKGLNKTKNEYHSRLVVFFQIIFLVFVGYTLGIKKGRGKGRNNTAIAAIVFIGYYAFYFFLLSLSQKAKLDPMIANYLPALILFLIGIKFYRDLDWAN